MDIRRINEVDDVIGEFIDEEFSQYSIQNKVDLNYEDFCFVAEDEGKIIGVITGRAYYNEIHIGDLIVSSRCRDAGIGSSLVRAVEEAYKDRCYDKITLTTFGFQAPEFYKKLGYELEFVREDKNPKLSKYFFMKKLSNSCILS